MEASYDRTDLKARVCTVLFALYVFLSDFGYV